MLKLIQHMMHKIHVANPKIREIELEWSLFYPVIIFKF